MERIAEAQQPGDLAGGVQLVGDHAGDAAAHRLAADDELALGGEVGDCRAVFGIERLGARRRLALA